MATIFAITLVFLDISHNFENCNYSTQFFRKCKIMYIYNYSGVFEIIVINNILDIFRNFKKHECSDIVSINRSFRST